MKKAYQRPTLARHGSVEKMTLDMLGLFADGGTMLLMMMGEMAGS